MAARRSSREKAENDKVTKDPDYEYDTRVSYLSDSELKEVKGTFRARDVSDESGWLKVCDVFLRDKLASQEAILDKFCVYLSPHKKEQAHLFIAPEVDWKKATRLSEVTGMGFSRRHDSEYVASHEHRARNDDGF